MILFRVIGSASSVIGVGFKPRTKSIYARRLSQISIVNCANDHWFRNLIFRLFSFLWFVRDEIKQTILDDLNKNTVWNIA